MLLLQLCRYLTSKSLSASSLCLLTPDLKVTPGGRDDCDYICAIMKFMLPKCMDSGSPLHAVLLVFKAIWSTLPHMSLVEGLPSALVLVALLLVGWLTLMGHSYCWILHLSKQDARLAEEWIQVAQPVSCSKSFPAWGF